MIAWATGVGINGALDGDEWMKREFVKGAERYVELYARHYGVRLTYSFTIFELVGVCNMFIARAPIDLQW